MIKVFIPQDKTQGKTNVRGLIKYTQFIMKCSKCKNKGYYYGKKDKIKYHYCLKCNMYTIFILLKSKEVK